MYIVKFNETETKCSLLGDVAMTLERVFDDLRIKDVVGYSKTLATLLTYEYDRLSLTLDGEEIFIKRIDD